MRKGLRKQGHSAGSASPAYREPTQYPAGKRSDGAGKAGRNRVSRIFSFEKKIGGDAAGRRVEPQQAGYAGHAPWERWSWGRVGQVCWGNSPEGPSSCSSSGPPQEKRVLPLPRWTSTCWESRKDRATGPGQLRPLITVHSEGQLLEPPDQPPRCPLAAKV